MQRALCASFLGGISCGVIGVWIIMMRIPFVGVAMSHAAFAGAICGLLFSVNPLVTAFLFCVASSALIGPLTERADIDPTVSLGIIFSLMLGLAFLGMGLMEGPKTEALNLMWGSILTVSRSDLILLAVTTGLLLLLLTLFFKEVQAVLFNREVARAAGIQERAIFYGLLFTSGIVVTTNLTSIGGLLIFSLIVNPPAAAYQITYNLPLMFFLSAAFGVLSCFIGLVFSYICNVPSGAVIIIVSSLVFIACLLLSPKRRVMKAH
ncbi:MAG: metal ABC transporter permease [Deltaproteobacteria bacterium]|nr:metal ABC transporter permease [Deltaproteobacteria bacterium]